MSTIDRSKIVLDPFYPQKYLKLRNGSDVFIYWMDEYVFHGTWGTRESAVTWNSKGIRISYTPGDDGLFDLVMITPEVVEYANVYEVSWGDFQENRHTADSYARYSVKRRIAVCKRTTKTDGTKIYDFENV